MNKNLLLVFSMFLLVGLVGPIHAQTSPGHVVINEVDINPPGDDSASINEWVELYNPTDSEINLGGWEIASTTVLKKTMTIVAGTTIQPGEFLTYSYQSVWFTDSNESVELRDENGIVIDKTPLLSDLGNDFTSWQRFYDGYDLDGSGDWKFVTSTAGSSNGKLIETQESESVSVTVSSEKSSYLFGDVAVISGSVSKEVNPVQPEFLPELIMVRIIGPNFDKTVSLYPDLNLNYETTLSLHQVLGIDEGNYDVSVSYGGASADTSFFVGTEIIQQAEIIDGSFNITTDYSQYIPGQTVSITGTASEIIPFEGMKFTITDSQGVVISNGNLFPTDGKFSVSLFLTTVNPQYGTYEILAEYSDKSTSATFEVLEDIKEDVPISLWTDKEVYGVGDTVNISGRLNNLWVDSLNLEILQTKNISLGVDEQSGGGSVLKILDLVRLDGDSKFEYSFTIPNTDTRLGDYLINVHQDVGSVTKIIKVVENPETYVLNTAPLVITTNRLVYDFNLDKELIISGQIIDPVTRSSFESPVVKITILTGDGSPLEIIASTDSGQLSTSGVSVGYDFTAIPEAGGTFSIKTDLNRLIFSEGTYLINAKYENLLATTSFDILDDLKGGSIVSIDKEIYGLGETVYMTGILTTSDRAVDITLTRPDGTVANSGASIDNQRFSWSWSTPISESYQNIKIDDGRDVTKSNIGLYKIHVSSSSYGKDLFFKVSLDPENDSISTVPIFVSTEKSLYKAGEQLKVVGNVILREQGSEGLVVPDRVTIKIIDGTFPFKEIHQALVYPTQGGEYSSLFELPITIFSEGNYKVKAVYDGKYAENIFGVANDFVFGIDDPVSLLVSTDKTEYYPGDVVIITGKPNKLIYLEAYDIGVIQKSDTEITCGSFVCGTNIGPITSILPSPSGSFVHEFMISDTASSIGLYEVSVDANFETKYVQFNVVENISPVKLNTIVEKENRIADKTISILTEEKTHDSSFISPRVLSGSLITPTRGEESSVNLKVSSESGICIIGPDVDCLVSESTRKPGQIYDVVEVDGMNLNVRYSGPDVRLEKFSILPESSTEFLPNSNWNVEIIKDDQVSRFYYKVTFKTLE
jgi:hypothetical protein